MTTAQEYLFKAAELQEIADREKSPTLKDGYRKLSDCYLRLAEQAEQNKKSSI